MTVPDEDAIQETTMALRPAVAVTVPGTPGAAKAGEGPAIIVPMTATNVAMPDMNALIAICRFRGLTISVTASTPVFAVSRRASPERV